MGFPLSHFYFLDTPGDTKLNATHAKDCQGLLRDQHFEILARAAAVHAGSHRHSCNTVNSPTSFSQALIAKLPANVVQSTAVARLIYRATKKTENK